MSKLYDYIEVAAKDLSPNTDLDLDYDVGSGCDQAGAKCKVVVIEQ